MSPSGLNSKVKICMHVQTCWLQQISQCFFLRFRGWQMIGITLGRDTTMFGQVTYLIFQTEIKNENLREKCMSRPVWTDLADFSEFYFSGVEVAYDRNKLWERTLLCLGRSHILSFSGMKSKVKFFWETYMPGPVTLADFAIFPRFKGW